VAKPVRLGMVLEGSDAEDFDRYLERPDCTQRGIQLIRESAKRSETFKFK